MRVIVEAVIVLITSCTNARSVGTVFCPYYCMRRSEVCREVINVSDHRFLLCTYIDYAEYIEYEPIQSLPFQVIPGKVLTTHSMRYTKGIPLRNGLLPTSSEYQRCSNPWLA